MYRILLFILISVFSVSFTAAQQNLPLTANQISVSGTGTSNSYYADRKEPARAIEFKEKSVTPLSFVANINQYFDIGPEFTFVEAESNTDALGMRHRLLQQHYNGIPIEGLGYRMHERYGYVTSANGRSVRSIKLNTQTTVSEDQAFRLAVQHLDTKDTTIRHGKKLIVSKGYTYAPESFSIAFQFDIDVSLIEQWRISIDAGSGQVINKVSLVNTCRMEEQPKPFLPYGTGTGLTRYYGNKTIRVEEMGNGSSRLVGQTEHGGQIGTYDFQNVNILSLLWFFEYHKVYDVYSADNTYNSDYHKAAVSAQWAMEQAYEYYFQKHNRNSFDNLGSIIKSYVHVDEKLNNAFWTHNLLAIGDGSNNNPLVELDVISHELTHGVTQFEAALQYYGESGALNESFSDIFGKAVEFDTFGDTATWQIARRYTDGGFRNMSNPNLKNQPDTYAGDMWYTEYDDYGGVHTNSGVQNFWYYLLCEGGSGINDRGLNYSVNAIGIDVATKIAYRNLTEYLSPISDYLDSRVGSMLATADLYGKNSAAYQEVDKAWDAVGVTDEPIINSLNVYDITGTTVKLKGSLLPRGNNPTYHFEYGITPALGTSSAIYPYVDKVEGILTGLQSQTKYYLRLVATNDNGSSFYPLEFTTRSLAPLVKIKQTVDVTETTATLYGEINPNSLTSSFYFEYGPTPAFGSVTQTYPLAAGTEFVKVSAPVTSLQRRQTYYYRLIATNGFASSPTTAVSFFTAVKPIISSHSPITAPVGAEVTINGQNFNVQQDKNLISFGATRATILSSSSTQIVVKVPSGASFGPISLLDAESGLTALSVREFVPTFTGEFKKTDLLLTVGINDLSVYQTLVEDMDGDKKPDIVARHYKGFSVLQNVNQGGDITEQSFVRNTFNAEYSSGVFSLVDFDGNGLKDIVAQYQSNLRIYPNFSIPGYMFFGSPVDIPDGGTFQSIIYDDFDMDGHVDIAGIISLPDASSQVTIVRNENPAGPLSGNNFEQRYTKALPYMVYFISASDLDNNGTPDILVGSYGGQGVSILKNNGHPGAFSFEESAIQDMTRGRFARYFASDLNEDGWKDITSHSPYEEGNVAIFENKGTTPNISMESPDIALSGYEEISVQPGDINGDGKVDLVVNTDKREFFFLKNKTGANADLSTSSFEKFGRYGMSVTDVGGHVETQTTINDLNGDGRPEVINTHSYYYGPRDGYLMEIWQNAPRDCLDPSLVRVEVSNYSATIVLPPNTTMDQFEMAYTQTGYSYWWQVSSPLINISPGYSYQLRVRSKCYLGVTEYYYITFTADCVNTSSFSVDNIGVNSVSLNAYDLGSFEIQYSLAGKDDWQAVPQYSNQILDLLPGTTYDVRLRGRCYTPTEFTYRQFTTLCPTLFAVTVTNLTYNKATVNASGTTAGNVVFEYSEDNVAWKLIDENRTMFPLTSATKYFVRASTACTDTRSDFVYTNFTTPCPQISLVYPDHITPFSARINWVDESEVDSYTVKYSLTDGGPVTTLETSALFFDLDGLTPGTRYTVSVAPHCTGNKTFNSIEFNTVCYIPFALSASDITYTTAELSWKDNFTGVPYTIEYTISGSGKFVALETTRTEVSLTGLRPGTSYEARVHINCLSEKAAYTSVLFKTELYDETTFGPNPTESNITLRPSKNVIGNRFIIFDSTGRIVVSGELLDYTIDLSYFYAGIYTLKIEGEKPIKIVKL